MRQNFFREAFLFGDQTRFCPADALELVLTQICCKTPVGAHQQVMREKLVFACLIRRVDGKRMETKNQHAIFDSYADWHAGCSKVHAISQLWLIPEKSGVLPRVFPKDLQPC